MRAMSDFGPLHPNARISINGIRPALRLAQIMPHDKRVVPSVRIVHDKRATLAQEHPGHKGALYAPPPVHKSEVEPLILVE